MKQVFLHAVKMAFVGLLVGPLLALTLVLAAVMFDPKCGGPGDSGGCAMGIVAAPVMVALPSMGLFFVVAFLLGVRRLDREKPLC